MPVPPPLLNGRVRELTLGMLFESSPAAQTPGLRHLLGLPLPPWQRPEVWTVTQKQKFVEGLFLGFASGQYVVNGQDWDSKTAEPLPCSGWLLDGQQRISALRDFVQGDLVVFGDVTYGSLPKAEQLRFMRKPFPCFELHRRTGRGAAFKAGWPRKRPGGEAAPLERGGMPAQDLRGITLPR